jgi:hypothetical protein
MRGTPARGVATETYRSAFRARHLGLAPGRPAAGPMTYSSTPFTFPSARRFSMIFCAMCGGTGS